MSSRRQNRKDRRDKDKAALKESLKPKDKNPYEIWMTPEQYKQFDELIRKIVPYK